MVTIILIDPGQLINFALNSRAKLGMGLPVIRQTIPHALQVMFLGKQ